MIQLEESELSAARRGRHDAPPNFILLKLFGVKKLPDGELEPIVFDGIHYFVISRASARFNAPDTRRPHRIFAYCPDCGKAVPAGRLGQHRRAHQHKAAA